MLSSLTSMKWTSQPALYHRSSLVILPLQYGFCFGIELLSQSQGELNQMWEKGSCYFRMLAACQSFVLFIKKKKKSPDCWWCEVPHKISKQIFYAAVGPSLKLISPVSLSSTLDQRIRKDQQEGSSSPRTLIVKLNVYIPGFQQCQLSHGSNIIL